MKKPPYDAPFIWAVGIEDTNVGWPLAGSPTGLDEYEATRHYTHWREDLALAASIGATQIRYGFPWYRINPAPGVWDWSWTDAVVAEANRLGLIVDLVHYGTPTWLKGSFTDPGYPEAVASYARAVAKRYRGKVAGITPLNEPLVTASFVGLRGIWPPHEIGQAGLGAGRGVARRRHPAQHPRHQGGGARTAHRSCGGDPCVDRRSGPEGERQLLDHKNFLPTDLVLGRVDVAHALHAWLIEHGIAAERLAALAADAQMPDVIGVNYYPELSARES